MPAHIYRASPPDMPLRQGELLKHVVQVVVDLNSLNGHEVKFREKSQPLSLIVTQDCDLEQDFHSRFGEKKKDSLLISSILFCEVMTAQELSLQVKDLGSIGWKRIVQNNDIRYHFLQKPPPEFGSDGVEMAIDFKRYFAIPTGELYARISANQTNRYCCIESPYMENLCQRFANFLSRIALPEPHSSE